MIRGITYMITFSSKHLFKHIKINDESVSYPDVLSPPKISI